MHNILNKEPKEVLSEDSLSSYILVIDDLIDKKLLEKTIDRLEDIQWKKSFKYDFPNSIIDSRYNDIFSEGSSLDIDFYTSQFDCSEDRDFNTISLPFEKVIYQSLYSYIFEYYKFDWYKKWYNFTQARFNKYDTGMFMKKHCDHFRTMFDGKWKGVPVYSVIGFLNDDYEGGDLVFWDDTVIEKKAGSVVIFPSNFLYPHQVTEVTNGTRYTFSSYAF